MSPSLRSRLAPIAGLSAVAVLALLASLNLWRVVPAAWADASSLRARSTVNDWRDGHGPVVTPERWEQTRAQLQDALDTAPGNAQLHDDLGFLHAARSQSIGQVPVGSPAQQFQQTLMDSAIGHYRTACALRPTHPYTWTYLALAKHYRGLHDAEFWAAYDRALQYGRSEAALQVTLAVMAFDQWDALGLPRQQLIGSMVATAKAQPRATMQELAGRAGVQLPG